MWIQGEGDPIFVQEVISKDSQEPRILAYYVCHEIKEGAERVL